MSRPVQDPRLPDHTLPATVQYTGRAIVSVPILKDGKRVGQVTIGENGYAFDLLTPQK